MINTIIKGDCMEVMNKIDQEIDLILTDPPFMISRECKITRSMNPQKHYKYKGKDINLYFGEWDSRWKDENEYLNWTYSWLKECFEVLKEGGHFVSFYDRLKIPFLVNFAKENGMIMRQFLLMSNSEEEVKNILKKKEKVEELLINGKMNVDEYSKQLDKFADELKKLKEAKKE